MYFCSAIDISRSYTTQTKAQLFSFKDSYSPEECNLVLGTSVFQGAYYDGRRVFSEYDIVYEKIDMHELGDGYTILMNPFMVGRCEKK